MHIEFRVEDVEPRSSLEKFVCLPGVNLDTAPVTDEDHYIQVLFGYFIQETFHGRPEYFNSVTFWRQTHGLPSGHSETVQHSEKFVGIFQLGPGLLKATDVDLIVGGFVDNGRRSYGNYWFARRMVGVDGNQLLIGF